MDLFTLTLHPNEEKRGLATAREADIRIGLLQRAAEALADADRRALLALPAGYLCVPSAAERDLVAEACLGISRRSGLGHFPLDPLLELLQRVGEQPEIQFFLVAEVEVDRPLAYLGRVGDVFHAHFVEALRTEQPRSRLDNLLSLGWSFDSHNGIRKLRTLT